MSRLNARIPTTAEGGYRLAPGVQLLRTITTGSTPYGPLQAEFHYDARYGYTALVGPNNAGKSSLLQLIFRTLHGDGEFGAERIALILTDRDYVDATIQPGSRTLSQWNSELVQNFRSHPLGHAGGHVGPARSELPRLLMHGNLLGQIRSINKLLARLGLPTFEVRGAQELSFGAVSLFFQGTGLRALLPILAALTNPDVRVILIDEPELSLEPRLQKALRDILVGFDKTVIVTTHSHLFLARNELEANQVVTRAGTETVVRTLHEQRELQDVTFDLLGSSTEDLFFPGNYLIVEGASDQAIASKALELLGAPPPTVKVLSARGVDAVSEAVASVVRALVPLIVNDSPYAERVIALIDQPRNPDAENVVKLQGDLCGRLFMLDAPSMEEYLPEALYTRAGRSKDDDLRQLTELRGDYRRAAELKREISVSIADALSPDDLEEIPLVTDAVRASIELAPR